MKTTDNAGSEIWRLKEHGRVKHILLEKYLKAWIPILGKYESKICYFDGFAGPGEYSDGEVGSPIIALRTASSLDKYFNKMICIFVEKDDNNLINLKNKIELEKQNLNLSKIDYGTENNEFAKVVDDILKSTENIIPSFFFIDPFGYSHAPFKIIKKIMQNPKT